MIVAISAAGALLNYLEETQKDTLTFRKINVLRRESKMLLDAITLKNLEIINNMRTGGVDGTLLWVMDETHTSMGGRLLRNWLINPLIDAGEIRQRQDAVASLMTDSAGLSKIQDSLKSIYDIERLASRIGSGSANARDLLSLKNSLETLPGLKAMLHDYDDETIKDLSGRIDIFNDVKAIIEKSITDDPPLTIKEGGLIRKGFSPEIDELKEISTSGKDYIASLQVREREKTGKTDPRKRRTVYNA
jgi:DNA mismatch repair protein MutS